MPDLEPEALAAVAAAYAILMQARDSTPAPTPRWRLAARMSVADADPTRVRRSRWSAATAP
jgi:CelD/BcsL family acetyltransferase involved in cellulose biosynthesis